MAFRGQHESPETPGAGCSWAVLTLRAGIKSRMWVEPDRNRLRIAPAARHRRRGFVYYTHSYRADVVKARGGTRYGGDFSAASNATIFRNTISSGKIRDTGLAILENFCNL